MPDTNPYYDLNTLSNLQQYITGTHVGDNVVGSVVGNVSQNLG